MQLSNVSKRIGSAVACCLVASIAVLGVTGPATAATPAEIEQAIVDGLDYLAGQQNPDGSWESGCYTVAYTSLVCLKFEDRARELGFSDPTDPAYEYGVLVEDCLDYILGKAYDDGPGRAFNACPGNHDTYNVATAVMALSASNQANPAVIGPEVSGGLAWLLWAQIDPGNGVHTGGWGYGAGDTWSDNSNGGYATLGLDYASAPPPRGWGLTIPAANLADLSTWITALQDPTGFSWYVPGIDPWPCIYRTGNLLQQMALVGDTAATPRVQLAVGYIEANWNAPGGGIYAVGWRDHRQAMFGMMKGFESLGIDLIDHDGDTIADHDWFDEVSTHLVATQNPDGSWPVDPWSGQIASTAWALLTLEKVVAQPGEVIPTVSGWGLVIISLMLLAGAKVYFGRRAMQA